MSGAQAENGKQWLYFTDKGHGQTAEISDKAMHRRSLRGAGYGMTEDDIYPDSNYILAIKEIGMTVHQVSRWLNAASVSGPLESWQEINNLDFLKKISPVAAFKRNRLIIDESAPDIKKEIFNENLAAFDYGPSFSQIHLCQIDSLHSLGFSGRDILIGIMDTGFKIDHPVFADIISTGRLIAAHDFINNDDDVQDSSDFQQDHGTAVWSVLGGFNEGVLIGAAFGADFILAETEIETDEITAEEDNWIAAAEWMEAQGVDIISSSLGYIDWYDQSVLNGDSAAITIAADIAASLGVVVVNAAGNERDLFWDAVTPPADGDSVIAAGGVNSQGLLYNRSSPGPTADGRIKPDVSAMALGVTGAYYYNDGFRLYAGTSFAAPVIAGGIALILETYPDWNLDTLFNRLRLTASKAHSPDNDYGWGIARFYNMYAGRASNRITQNVIVVPSPAVGTVVFRFLPPLTTSAEISLFTVAGDKIKTINIDASSVSDGEGLSDFQWDAKNKSGDKIASGIYIAHLQTAAEGRTIKFAFVK